ncbi:MAG TPA: hypothetical protein VII06_15665 [Chloroflexota bacterium]|jgi:hypothetical protein
MQSSSLLPASSVRSFRVRAPRAGPPLPLVVAAVLLLLGGLAGALALGADGTWLNAAAAGVRALPGWPGAAAEPPDDGPIAMPVRVPLDPVVPQDREAVAVAEAPAGSSPRAAGEVADAETVGSGPGAVSAPAAVVQVSSGPVLGAAPPAASGTAPAAEATTPTASVASAPASGAASAEAPAPADAVNAAAAGASASAASSSPAAPESAEAPAPATATVPAQPAGATSTAAPTTGVGAPADAQ